MARVIIRGRLLVARRSQVECSWSGTGLRTSCFPVLGGRPACVRLAVLVDRGGRELPVAADFAATQLTLPDAQVLALARSDSGAFSLKVEENA